MVYLLLLFILLMIIVDFVKNKKIYTPGFVFNTMFFVVLFLYNFYLSDLQQKLTNKTIIILFLSVLSFNLAIILYNLIFPEKKELEKPLCKKIENKDSIKRNRYIFYGIHSSIIIIFLIEVIVCKGCPFFWRILGSSGTYMTFGVPYLDMTLYVSVVIMGVYTMFKKNDFTKFTYLLISILMVSRGLMLEIIGGGIFYKLITSKTIKKQTIYKLCIIGVLAILMFSIIGNFRTGEDEFLRVAQFKPEFDWIPTGFKWIYAYICFSFSNLNNLFSIISENVGYGIYMLNGCLPYIVKWRLNFRLPKTPKTIIDPHFNVSTGFIELYLDFGVIGIIVFFFILGLYLEKLKRLSNKNNLFGVLYALSMINIVFFVHNNRFFTVNFILEALVLINSIPYIKSKKIKIKNFQGGKI